jgi:uncharacterized protein YqiB (DUF1249 family)
MLADSDIVPECIAVAGTFGGLVSLYEGNFLKVSTLLGDPRNLPMGAGVSRSPTDCDLHVAVEEGSRYTRLLRLTYLFDEPSGTVADPDLVVRLYLDARVAEVVSWAAFHRHETLAALAQHYARELDRRWVRNMVLSKWLDFLLGHGHRYGVNCAR